MRKVTKYKPLFRGLTATMATLLAVSTAGYAVADTWRSTVDDVLGTQSYEVSVDKENARYTSDYETIDDLIEATKQVGIRQGEEGTVIMKNDKSALPLAANTKIALYGAGAYLTYPYLEGDLKGGNPDAKFLRDALADAGFKIDATLDSIYSDTGLFAYTTESGGGWGGKVTTIDYAPSTSPGDFVNFKINEVPTSRFTDLGKAPSNWQSTVDADVAICVFSRPGGEANTYKPGSAVDFNDNPTGEDPLALSEDELTLIDSAKAVADKVIVLLNTGNAMEIGAISKGGSHEVDAIAYIGVPNDYQCIGVVNVLKGDVNSTGALSDTYVYNNESSPAMQNFGGGDYSDAAVIASNASSPYGRDYRFGDLDIGYKGIQNSFLRDVTYSASHYIVEAEGIYVGYKYYETRYYDSIVNPSYNASGSAGATDKNGWSYDEEVVYTFGHGLSLLSSTQQLKSVDVEDNINGNVTAVISITNTSDKSGKFLGQLYYQSPYTQYDKDNEVEKSAIQFLNSAKVDVPAGETRDVTITVPTKYLASYDYTSAKTYILDGGTYYFATGAGAHDALNNILTAQGHTGDAAGNAACVKTWSNGAETATDTTTYSVSQSGKIITNVVDNADLNYYLPGTVTYLSRSDWQGTYPKNYNKDVAISIASSSKAQEWVDELRGQQYKLGEDGTPAQEAVDNGVKFQTSDIGYAQLTNINDPFWNSLVAEITIDQAVGAVIHGGSQSDALDNIDNPIVIQNEGVNGFTTEYEFTDEEKTTSEWYKTYNTSYSFNISSQTLLGTSFNPELAYEWGLIEGESGLRIERYAVWGTGLTQRRTAYNGRNYEYISEDEMLTNRIGERFTEGTIEKGILSGAKHIGFNDQEYFRSGLGVYINEQKFRETDLRGFQGALEDGDAMAVMVAFNRIGPVNAPHSRGMITTMLREEWNFQGLISTDMCMNNYYFSAESMVWAGITQVADFGRGDSTISGGETGADANWPYISVASLANEGKLVEQARQNLKWQLFAFANSGVMNMSTVRVTPWWETMFKAITITTAVLTGLAGAAYVTCKVFEILPEKKEEN